MLVGCQVTVVILLALCVPLFQNDCGGKSQADWVTGDQQDWHASPHPVRPRANQKVTSHMCTHCGRVFSRANNLRDHARTHTGEKPYQCPICPYAATHKSNLNAHIRKRHSELQADK